MKKLLSKFQLGSGLKAKAIRGSALTLISFGGSNALRLASNLILTRILFPEVFGLMALVQVFTSGLQMFSDLGIRASIMQNPRGDDPKFLNTAWTLQIGRGFFLWLAGCALAIPAANLYNEPLLAQLLPIVGLNAVISGFKTTNLATANRHLLLGRLTAIELGCQAIGVTIMVILAYWLQSIWALVFGGLLGTTIKTVLLHLVLPGIKNRLEWDKSAVGELIGFGKYVFLSTIAGFFVNQSDRAVLGAYISMAALGVYNVGYFLGTVPLMLNQAAADKVIFPLYRMRPPAESDANRAALFRARRFVIASSLTISTLLAFASIPLVDALYDPRYVLAGPVIALFCLAMVPQIVFGDYSVALLATGDSRRFFYLQGSTAFLQVVFLFIGINSLGILGAALAPGIAALAMYPMRISFARRYKAWDAKADLVFLSLGFSVNGIACWLYWDQIKNLLN